MTIFRFTTVISFLHVHVLLNDDAQILIMARSLCFSFLIFSIDKTFQTFYLRAQVHLSSLLNYRT